MDLRPVLFIIGHLLVTLAAGMAVPFAVGLYHGGEDWQAFFVSILITAFFGGMIVIICSDGARETRINVRQGFLLAALGWVVVSLFGALPFWLSSLQLSLTDSIFESVSGITTTGSTVIVGLETLPRSFLFWRATLQWLGGIGVIMMALSVLPFLKIGGMQIFQMQSEEAENALPRSGRLVESIWSVYILLTILCAFFYHYAGLDAIDSVTHAMTTVSSGGFSNYDDSFGAFDSAGPHLVAMVFMILAGIPFILYLQAVRGEPGEILKDSQVRGMIAIILLSAAVLALHLRLQLDVPLSDAAIPAAFAAVSVVTGTGYVSGDYAAWGSFAVALLFFMMAIGGCAGSTASGIKIFRFQILYAVAAAQARQLLFPHSPVTPRYNGKPLPKDVPISVMSFFFVYGLAFALLATALSLTGLDFTSSLSGAMTSLSNVGPGFGTTIGPAANYAEVNDAAKWILAAGMLLGRLELFSILVLLSPRLWRP